MRVKVKMRLTIPVTLELTTEWNKRARQSVIVDAKIDDDNLVTPRMVYEAMKGGEFSSMDNDSVKALLVDFDEVCAPYQDKPDPKLPNPELRGIPLHPNTWAKWMTRRRGAHLTLPVRLVLELVKGLESHILIEPVLGTVPTAYIWNVHPEKDVLDHIAKQSIQSMKAPHAERLEEGCLRLRWK